MAAVFSALLVYCITHCVNWYCHSQCWLPRRLLYWHVVTHDASEVSALCRHCPAWCTFGYFPLWTRFNPIPFLAYPPISASSSRLWLYHCFSTSGTLSDVCQKGQVMIPQSLDPWMRELNIEIILRRQTRLSVPWLSLISDSSIDSCGACTSVPPPACRFSVLPKGFNWTYCP